MFWDSDIKQWRFLFFLSAAVYLSALSLFMINLLWCLYCDQTMKKLVTAIWNADA